MAISPILFNGTISLSQDISNIKSHEDNQSSVLHVNAQRKFEEQINESLTRVREGDDVKNNAGGFDAREKGKNEYTGDGGIHRKKKKTDGDRFFMKSEGGFDISI